MISMPDIRLTLIGHTRNHSALTQTPQENRDKSGQRILPLNPQTLEQTNHHEPISHSSPSHGRDAG